MTAGLRLLQPKSPEWLRSGRYFLLALALHVIVLLYPQTLIIANPEVMLPSPLMATLQETISVPPVVQPPARSEKVPTQTIRHHEKLAPTPRPVIAMAPESVTVPAAFTAPAPVAAAPDPPLPQAAPASASPAGPPTVTAAHFDAAYLHSPELNYPPISQRRGEEGKVLLRVRVTPAGRPAAVDIEKSSGFERLDNTARQAVAHWSFVPARRGNEAIEGTIFVPIDFRLEN